jgi:hypothetical protein
MMQFDEERRRLEKDVQDARQATEQSVKEVHVFT